MQLEIPKHWLESPVVMVPVSEIGPHAHPEHLRGSRGDAEYTENLKAQIKKVGIKEPIIVRRFLESEKKKLGIPWNYSLQDGGHRFVLAQELGHKFIPARILTIEQLNRK